MRIRTVALLGIFLSLVMILIIANHVEDGDMNAVSMYLIVFLIPAIILSVLNAFFIQFLNRFIKGLLKVIMSFIPIAILIPLCFINNVAFPFIDGELSFVATVASISLGITNLIWAISYKR